MDKAQAQNALDEISRQVAELRAMIDTLAESPMPPAPTPDPAPPPPGPDPTPPSPTPDPIPTPMPDPDPVPTPPAIPEPTPPPIPEPSPPPIPEPTPPVEIPPATANGSVDDAAARLVAMRMAIDGGTREQLEAELAAKFGPGDRSRLLDEVLARAGR